MAKEITLRVEFLVQGLFPMEAFTFHNFELQTIKTDEELFEGILKDNPLYAPQHLMNATFQEGRAQNSRFLSLTNSNYTLEIDHNQDNWDKEQVNKYVQEKLRLLRDSLERELKLITNIDIALPVAIAKASNTEEFGSIFVGLISGHNSSMKVFQYTEKRKDLLSRRLSRGISMDSLDELGDKNSRFERALEFYFSSFVTSNKSISFTLLFSSLEALFNLTGKRVTHSIASATSKILFVDEAEEKNLYGKIKDFYDKRSFYIHGNEPKDITEEIEFELREIVRKAILIYWQISLTENLEDSRKLVKFIEENKQNDLNLPLKLFIKHLEDKDYKDLYNDMIGIIENKN